MSSDIRELILEEIGNIDEMLLIHSYHRQALRELLAKISPPEQLEIEVEPVNPVTPQRAIVRPPSFKSKCRSFGEKVAQLVKEKGLTKKEAVIQLSDQGLIDRPVRTACAMVAPSNLGKRFHNKLFEGTPYGKQ
jgi:hypothetical protein